MGQECWETDPELFSQGLSLSENRLVATRVAFKDDPITEARISAFSTAPVEDITVKLATIPSSSGCVYIGLIGREFYAPNIKLAVRDFCFSLCPYNGVLYGGPSSANGAMRHYCPPFKNGLIRVVHDRATRMISFDVNGVSHGPAFTDVPDVPMHLVAFFYWAGDSLEIIDD